MPARRAHIARSINGPWRRPAGGDEYPKRPQTGADKAAANLDAPVRRVHRLIMLAAFVGYSVMTWAISPRQCSVNSATERESW